MESLLNDGIYRAEPSLNPLSRLDHNTCSRSYLRGIPDVLSAYYAVFQGEVNEILLSLGVVRH